MPVYFSKVFRRLEPLFFRILTFFLSLLIPIIIIGTIFYIHINNQIIHEETLKTKINLESSIKTNDIYMRVAQETSLNIFHDKTIYLQPYTQYKDDERIQIQYLVQKLQQTHSNLSAMIDEIFLLVDDNKVYTSEGIFDFDSFFNNYYLFEQYDEEFWLDKLSTSNSLEFLELSTIRKKNVTWDVIPLVMSNTINGYKTVLVTTILVDRLKETIGSFESSESSYYVVMDHQDKVIVSSFDAEQTEELVPQLQSSFGGELEVGAKQANKQLHVLGKKSIVVRSESDHYGWSYYVIKPLSVIKQQTSYFFVLILLICLALVVIGIIFSFVFTFIIYNPIKRIHEIIVQEDLNTEQVSISPELNNLHDIGQGVHRIVEFKQQFKTDLELISNELKDQGILHFLYGNTIPKNEEELHNMFRELIRVESPYYLCCNVKIGFKPAFYSEIQDTERLIIFDKLKNIIWGLIPTTHPSYVIEDEHQLYVCLFSLDQPEDAKQIKVVFEQFISLFESDLKYCYIHIGIGKVYNYVRSLKNSYVDAMYSLDAAGKNSDFEIVESEQLSPAEMIYSYSFMDEDIILNCLQTQSREHLEQKVEEILEKNDAIGTYLKIALLSEMYRTGYRFIAERKKEVQQFISDDTIAILESQPEVFSDIHKKKQALLLFFNQIIQQTESQKSNPLHMLVPTILEYIEENYEQDLYLEKIADELGVSAKYMSSLFKEATDVNLSSYISQFRISKAKELLTNTDIKISDIAEKVGIFSRTTFIRLFKKYAGMTPSEYRSYVQYKPLEDVL